MAFSVSRVSKQVGRGLCAVTVTWCVSFTSPASAQPVDDATRAAARKLGATGLSAFEEHDYATASDKLSKAFHVLQAPSLGLWSARALEKLGKLVEAQERYLIVTRLDIVGGDAEVQRKARAEAATDLAALSQRVPSIVVQVEGTPPSGVTVTVDGTELSPELVGEAWPVNPGSHHLVGTHDGEKRETDVVVAEGQHPTSVLRFGGALATGVAAAGPQSVLAAQPASGPLEPAQAPQRDAGFSSWQRSAGWATLAAGATGFAVSGVTGIMTLVHRSDLHQGSDCYGTSCATRVSGKVDSYNSMRTASTVSFVVGTALAATGVVLILTAPKAKAPSAALVIQPGSAAIQGTF